MGKRVGIIECTINSNSAKNGTSTVAHTQNANIISKNLGYEYFATKEDLFYALQLNFDVLIFTPVNVFSDYNTIKEIIKKNKNTRKIFLTNDYKLSPHCELNKYDYEIIANYELKKQNKKYYFLNLNSLMTKTPLKQINKKYDCIYWGTYRKNRKKSFLKYLKNDVYVSTNKKNISSFINLGCNCHFINKINWQQSITNLFKYSLYIEDEWIHDNFHNLANRWYEAGIYNNVMFFDNECKNTILKSEISNVYDDFYTVRNYEELKEKIEECNKNFEKHLKIQQEWHKIDFETKNNVLNAIKKIVEE